jgi:hypothetical protein
MPTRFAAISAACAGSLTLLGASASTAEDSAIITRLHSAALAFEQRDLRAIERSFVNDDRLLIFEDTNINRGWKDYRNNHLAREFKSLDKVVFRLYAIEVHVSDKMAWATFTYRMGIIVNGNLGHGQGVGTAVLVKEASAWRIVHWHTSAERLADT